MLLRRIIQCYLFIVSTVVHVWSILVYLHRSLFNNIYYVPKNAKAHSKYISLKIYLTLYYILMASYIFTSIRRVVVCRGQAAERA